MESYFCNRIETLADELIQHLETVIREREDFHLPLLITPNSHLTKWFYLYWNQKSKLASAIQTKSLHEFFFEVTGNEDLQKISIHNEYFLSLWNHYQRETTSITQAFSLSAKATQTILDYELHRPDWWKEKLGWSPFNAEIASLYKKIPQSIRSKSLSNILKNFLEEKQKPRSIAPKIFIFGYGQFPELYIHFLEYISETIPVEIYCLCERDLDSENEYSFLMRDNRTRIAQHSKAKILEQDLSKKDSLSEFQKTITSSEKWNPPIQDESLHFLKAPDPFHELNQIKSRILKLLDSDKTLNLSEIGIFITDLEVYRPHVEMIFAPLVEKFHLDHSLADLEVSNASLVLKLLFCTLEILTTKVRFSHLLAIFTNPTFLDFSPYTIDDFREYLKVLETNSGYFWDVQSSFRTRNSFSEVNFRIQKSFVTNDQDSDVLFNAKFNPIAKESILFFSNLVESFFKDVRKLHYSLQKNFEFEKLFLFLRNWTNEKLEDHEMEILLDVERSLSYFTKLEFSKKQENFEEIISVLKQFFLQDFSQKKMQKGSYFQSGISISSLKQMRPIPFKHVFVVGLSERYFPEQRKPNPESLRTFQKKPGEYSEKEISHALLLETIYSARNSLTLSFPDRDLERDIYLEPSAVLQEFVSNSHFETVAIGESELLKLGTKKYRIQKTRVTKEDTIAEQYPIVFRNQYSLQNIAEFVKNPLEFHLKNRLRLYRTNLRKFPESPKLEYNFHLEKDISQLLTQRAVLQKDVILEEEESRLTKTRTTLPKPFSEFYFLKELRKLGELKSILGTTTELKKISLSIGNIHGDGIKNLVQEPIAMAGLEISGTVQNLFQWKEQEFFYPDFLNHDELARKCISELLLSQIYHQKHPNEPFRIRFFSEKNPKLATLKEYNISSAFNLDVFLETISKFLLSERQTPFFFPIALFQDNKKKILTLLQENKPVEVHRLLLKEFQENKLEYLPTYSASSVISQMEEYFPNTTDLETWIRNVLMPIHDSFVEVE